MMLMTWASACSAFRAAGIAVLLTTVLAGCGQFGTTETKQNTPVKINKNGPGTFADNSAMKKIQERDKLNVGIVFNQAPFAAENPVTGSPEGFDVDLVKWVAAGIFGSNIENKITYIEFNSRDLELALEQGKVDIVVGRYDVSASRKRFVDFAGPYYVTHQAVAVLERPSVRTNQVQTMLQLTGKKVCTVRGSTNTLALTAIVPGADVSTQRNTAAECGTDLIGEKVNAIAADSADIAPFLTSAGNAVRVLSAEYGATPYGVGVKKGSDDMRKYLNDRMTAWKGYKDSQRKWLDTVPGDTNQPLVDRY